MSEELFCIHEIPVVRLDVQVVHRDGGRFGRDRLDRRRPVLRREAFAGI